MKTLYLITFASGNQKGSISERHKELLSLLNTEYNVNIINIRNIDQLSDNDFKLIFISSGYVEHDILNNYEYLPHPMFLLTDGYNNSLSAAMEIKAWANSQSIKAEILYAESECILNKINTLYKIHQTIKSLQGKRIGVVGTPCKWLVSSSVNYLLAQRRWGVEFIDISTDELYKEFVKIKDDEVGNYSAEIATKAQACIEAAPEDLLKDMRLYKAINKIIEKYKLSAISINSFKINEVMKTSGCVAMSILNNDGIPSTGEGDLQSIFTSLVMKELTGEISFMGNVSDVNSRSNEFTLSYCTISTRMINYDYIIRSHYETGESVAIQGNMKPEQKVTIVKCGGESLDEFFVSTGVTVPHEHEERCCRTQIRVKIDSPVSYFITNPIGNHHLLIRNDHKDLIKAFFGYTSSKRIK